MFERIYRLAPHLRLARHTGGETFLVGEREHYVIHGRATQVLDLLDGQRTVEQVIDACRHVPAPLVIDALKKLEGQGVIAPLQIPEDRPFDRSAAMQAAFEAGATLTEPRRSVVLINATGNAGEARIMLEALEGASLQVAAEPGLDSIRVIVATDYLAPACIEAALAERRAGRACFLVKPAGLRPFIGPRLSPGENQPCMRCLSHALERQRPVERLVQRDDPEGRRPSPPRAALPASVAAAASLAAIELRKLLGKTTGVESGARLWTLDLVRFELTAHPVRCRPQCPECGDEMLMARRGERAITLETAPIGYRDDGGLRRDPPAQSYVRLRHLVSPILGPVAHLEPMPGRHTETRPVYSSGYFVVPRAGTEHGGFDRNCAGKGRTTEQARMGALAEAIERLSGVYDGDEATRHASYAELADEALHPNTLQLFSAAQWAGKDPAAGRCVVPPPLDERTTIAWTPGWSLSAQRRRWLPLGYCFSQAPASTGAMYCQASSNGSAAGTCIEEAILQGLFELCERDAVALWWYNRVRRPAARIPAALVAYFEGLRAEYAAQGWRAWTLDLTHDLGLPVVIAVGAHEQSDRFALGFGCHEDPELAFSRALTELNQVFDPKAVASSPWDGMSASRLAYLHPDASAPSQRPVPPIESSDLRDHVMFWVRRLHEHGLETIVVDKTRPDIELSVAQVVVPGLRHVWPRFAPGRLYTVPVELGWISAPLCEDQLNPLPLLV